MLKFEPRVFAFIIRTNADTHKGRLYEFIVLTEHSLLISRIFCCIITHFDSIL